MNLQYLRYAVEVARSGSITQSAANLYMAQPNLSKALKELEADIGIRVFRRKSTGVEVTEEGARFLSYAQHIIDEMDNLEFLYKRHQDNLVVLRFATVRSSYISRLFCDYLSRQPPEAEFQLQLKETTNYGVVEAVASGQADVGRIHFSTLQYDYFRSHIQSKGLVMELLWKVDNYLLMGSGHPLAHHGSILQEELAPYTEVVYGDFGNAQFTYQRLKQQLGLAESKRTVYVYDRGTLHDVLQNCPGTYQWTCGTHPDVMAVQGLVAVPCEGVRFSMIEAVIYPKRKYRHKEVRWILNHLKSMEYGESFLERQPIDKEFRNESL